MIGRYARWLHTRWPAGTVEALPRVRADGSTGVPGVYIAGDLTGVPLLKFALDGGARVARCIAEDLGRTDRPRDGMPDLVIIGAGVAGMAAAVEVRRLGLSCEVLEGSEPFSTLINLPRAKPIYTYPMAMTPAGGLQVGAVVKEALVEELGAQVDRAGIRPRSGTAERVEAIATAGRHLAGGGRLEARRVLIAIGAAGASEARRPR
jgi:thioredoxin reductase